MAKYRMTTLTVCLKLLLLLFGVASGASNVRNEDIHNYSTVSTQENAAATHLQREPNNALSLEAGAAKSVDSFQRNLSMLKQLNLVKRAPNGFIGMRGKKEYETVGDIRSSPLLWYDLASASSNEHENLEYDDTPNPLVQRWKKASNAFYGVRGKKYDDINYLKNYLHNLEEEHLRELMLQDFLDRLASATASDNEIAKRAPTGFTGVRGKRPTYDEDGLGDDELEKRAPNAFVGVRGKKDVSHQHFKRSPVESIGMRGRPQRFIDLSNKFVAVRGKKADASTAADGDLSMEFPDIHVEDNANENERLAHVGHRGQTRLLVNMLPSLLYGSTSGKRAPNGFLGMRGKRAVPDLDGRTAAGAVDGAVNASDNYP